MLTAAWCLKGMALHASVTGLHIVELGGIDDIRFALMIHMIASRPMTSFAADVPLRDLLCVDVVIQSCGNYIVRSRTTRRALQSSSEKNWTYNSDVFCDLVAVRQHWIFGNELRHRGAAPFLRILQAAD